MFFFRYVIEVYDAIAYGTSLLCSSYPREPFPSDTIVHHYFDQVASTFSHYPDRRRILKVEPPILDSNTPTVKIVKP